MYFSTLHVLYGSFFTVPEIKKKNDCDQCGHFLVLEIDISACPVFVDILSLNHHPLEKNLKEGSARHLILRQMF